MHLSSDPHPSPPLLHSDHVTSLNKTLPKKPSKYDPIPLVPKHRLQIENKKVKVCNGS
ncbi:hypothetical protein CAEBREN_08976 [Caenorhabditis brenneri]|uniref:Uncharacterized protein n=1 Tax=Caenorhabditis brenneri TaxID=135651 RepID=G0MB35_CAEBE|nr:hypothetical protein CAEBREN_08976 [Caenorhabditis brenneri]